MKISSYNFVAESVENSLLFNSRTGNSVVINNDLSKRLSQLDLTDSELGNLKSLGFVIDDSFDEFQAIQSIARNNTLNSTMKKYRILTTTGCNAKCFYCYEKGLKALTMTEDTALDVAKFIVAHANENDDVRVEWFGGEPLLNTRAIDVITQYVLNNLPAGCSYKAGIISNASVIDDEIIQKMIGKWKSKRIQITIDGVGENYVRVKQLGSNSFDHLVDNIKKLLDNGIMVDIRMNFNSDNLSDVEDVARYFSTATFKGRLKVYAAKIFSSETKRGYFDLEKESIFVEEILHKYGLKEKGDILPRVFRTGCMATYPGFFTIDPMGRVFKCDRRLLDKNSVATVTKYDDNLILNHEWNHMTVAEKCKHCKLYPLCWGGCIYDRINNIYPCYLTENIVLHSLKLALDDYNKEMKVTN